MSSLNLKSLSMPSSGGPVSECGPSAESLAVALSRLTKAAPTKVLMRHKRAGIWQCWTRAEFQALVSQQCAALAGRGIGPGTCVAVIGENHPELYAALIAAQALGADAMPLGSEFLRRFGTPEGGATLALAADKASARWWQGETLPFSALEAGGEEAKPSATPGRILLHDDGRNAAPRIVPHDLKSLNSAAARLAPEVGVGARLISFLPVSSLEDAALSLALPILTGAEVNCVEGPATFMLDLREVVPDALVGPARMWELIDRDICRSLGRGRDLVKAAKAPFGGLTFIAPLRSVLGLSRCRVAAVSSGAIAPGTIARFHALGLSFSNDHVPAVEDMTEAILRDAVVVDRARVWSTADGLQAEIATEPTEVAHLTDSEGLEALTDKLDAAAQVAELSGWALRDTGFDPHELTLFGDVRHFSTPPSPMSATVHAMDRYGTRDEVIMEAQNVSLAFGGIKALTDVSMDVRKGEILSIIGPNGAGKTSFLNTLNGIYTPKDGRIIFEGKARARMKPAEAAASGIGRTFQHVALFPGLNVIDNIVAGRAGTARAGFPGVFFARALRLASVTREESEMRAAAEAILDFLDLTSIRYRAVSTLPYGVQKRVEFGRALAAEPRILLLDEPMAGMAHEEKQEMCRFIRAANVELGTTIVLIEHDIGVVMGLSDRVVVLNYGRKIADGTPAEVRADPEVIRAYLGTGTTTKTGEG